MRSRRWMVLAVAALVLIPVACQAASQAVNLLLNPSFEVAPKEDGIAPGWMKTRAGDCDGWLKPWYGPVDDWVAAAGAWGNGGVVKWGQYVPCVPGQNVTFSMDTFGNADFNGKRMVKVEFYYPNTDGSSMALATASSEELTDKGSWTNQTVSVTAPAQATRVKAIGWMDAMSGSCKFDNGALDTSGTAPMVTPGEVKTLAAGTAVWLKWPVVTKDLGSDTTKTDCQVTGYQREGSVRVLCDAPIYSDGTAIAVAPGMMLYVAGTVAEKDGEKVLQATDIAPANPDGPWPWVYNLGSKSISYPPEKKGLLVRTWGKVASVAPDKSFFFVDDGAGTPAENPELGVKVMYTSGGANYPEVGDYITATGVCWPEGGFNTLAARKDADVQTVKIGPGGIGRNILLNPGFEDGKTNWYTPALSVNPEGWAARTGSLGMAFYTWDSYTEAYAGQNVGGIVQGGSYLFGAYLVQEPGHVGTIKLRIEWLDESGNPVGTPAEQIVSPVNDWGWFEVTGVAPAGTKSANFVIYDTDHSPGSGAQAIKVDDAEAKLTALP